VFQHVIQQLLDPEKSRMTKQIRGNHSLSWGSHSLQFKLPILSLQLTGLSAAQHDALKENYPGFFVKTARDFAGNDIECHAYQLNHFPAVLPDTLTKNGQYSPRIIRQQTSDIELTGINFKAQIGLNADPAPASLGVCRESELPQSNVIENFLRVCTAYRALRTGGVMLHSAGLLFDGQAYIFSGRSNAGKTTLTRKAYDKGVRVLSDDINLVLPGKAGYMAHAVPFTGEFGRTLDHQDGKKAYPLAGIILLEQDDQLETKPISQSQAVAGLLVGCPFVNADAEESERLFDSVIGLVSQLPVIRLVSRRNDNFDTIMKAVRKEFNHAKKR